jgi:hypothetical protein
MPLLHRDTMVTTQCVNAVKPDVIAVNMSDEKVPNFGDVALLEYLEG